MIKQFIFTVVIGDFMKNYDCLFKRELNELSLELSLDSAQKYNCSGWFREFSDFYDTFMGYGEL